MHKGEWRGKRVLDGKEVPVITAYFEENQDASEPLPIRENADMVFEGAKFLGEGFLLTHEEAETIAKADPRNRQVIFPLINGDELNNEPDQAPGRSIINFFDWPLEEAAKFELPFDRVCRLVKPVRERDNRSIYREK
jgi:hypothetical protein